ncbi:MAG: T9SS type A sorting domain-containing protein [bacterium]
MQKKSWMFLSARCFKQWDGRSTCGFGLCLNEVLATSVRESVNPQEFVLEQNYPNPFNPVTTIEFWTVSDGIVSLKVYNLLGEKVVYLVNEFRPAGDYQVRFDASSFASGIYLYKLQGVNLTRTMKMLLLR